jgi:hypothetical protein
VEIAELLPISADDLRTYQVRLLQCAMTKIATWWKGTIAITTSKRLVSL